MVEEIMHSFTTKPELLWIAAFAFLIGYLELRFPHVYAIDINSL